MKIQSITAPTRKERLIHLFGSVLGDQQGGEPNAPRPSREQILELLTSILEDEEPRKKQNKSKKAPDPIFLDTPELAALFGQVRAPKYPLNRIRNVAIFETAFRRGLRGSEVGLLQMADLDLDRETLYVHRVKHGISGEHFLSEREVWAFRAWIRIRGSAPGTIFRSQKRSPINMRTLNALMHRFAAAAGLPKTKGHFHCLRHSNATWLLERNVDIRQIQHHLGHVDIRNTQRYAQVTDRMGKEMSQRLYHEAA